MLYSRQEDGLHHTSSGGRGVISKQVKLQGGPAPIEPIQSISGFGFDSSRRDGDELFAGGESVSLRRSCHTYGIPRNSSTATPLLAEIVFKAMRASAGPSKTWSFSTARSA